MGEQREDRRAVGPLAPAARLAALELRARALDQLVVLHPGRAGGHAGHAAQAAVEVRDHLGRDLLALLVADPHEQDPPPRRVHLVLEHRVARARGQAEAAVHAVADEVQRRRMELVPGGRHIPPTKVPGRKIRAGSKRALSRSITTCAPPAAGHWSPTRSAPSSTAQARGASAWRTVATRSARSSPGSNASQESPSPARETTVAPFACAARITSGRSVGRPETFSTAPSGARCRA